MELDQVEREVTTTFSKSKLNKLICLRRESNKLNMLSLYALSSVLLFTTLISHLQSSSHTLLFTDAAGIHGSRLDQALQDTLNRLEDKSTSEKMYDIYVDPKICDEGLLYKNDESARLDQQQKTIDNKRNKHQTPKRSKRATSMLKSNSNTQQPKEQPQQQAQQLVDACQSKLEVLTPYYAKNAKGKLRIVVNSELMQQAIQVETCVRSAHIVGHPSGARCNANPDCGCEQKYKWHRLLVLDTNKDSQVAAKNEIFTDWFLFPSNCVCRCKSNKQRFLSTIIKKT